MTARTTVSGMAASARTSATSAPLTVAPRHCPRPMGSEKGRFPGCLRPSRWAFRATCARPPPDAVASSQPAGRQGRASAARRAREPAAVATSTVRSAGRSRPRLARASFRARTCRRCSFGNMPRWPDRESWPHLPQREHGIAQACPRGAVRAQSGRARVRQPCAAGSAARAGWLRAAGES